MPPSGFAIAMGRVHLEPPKRNAAPSLIRLTRIPDKGATIRHPPAVQSASRPASLAHAPVAAPSTIQQLPASGTSGGVASGPSTAAGKGGNRRPVERKARFPPVLLPAARHPGPAGIQCNPTGRAPASRAPASSATARGPRRADRPGRASRYWRGYAAPYAPRSRHRQPRTHLHATATAAAAPAPPMAPAHRPVRCHLAPLPICSRKALPFLIAIVYISSHIIIRKLGSRRMLVFSILLAAMAVARRRRRQFACGLHQMPARSPEEVTRGKDGRSRI